MARFLPTTNPEAIQRASQVTTSMRTMAGLAIFATSGQLAVVGVGVFDTAGSAVETGGVVRVDRATVTEGGAVSADKGCTRAGAGGEMVQAAKPHTAALRLWP